MWNGDNMEINKSYTKKCFSASHRQNKQIQKQTEQLIENSTPILLSLHKGIFYQPKTKKYIFKTYQNSKAEEGFLLFLQMKVNQWAAFCSEYFNLSEREGCRVRRRRRQSSAEEPELSRTDRREGHYQASLTEVILRVESCSLRRTRHLVGCGCQCVPWIKVKKRPRDIKKDWDKEREWKELSVVLKASAWTLTRLVSSAESNMNSVVSNMHFGFKLTCAPFVMHARPA